MRFTYLRVSRSLLSLSLVTHQKKLLDNQLHLLKALQQKEEE